MEDLGLSLSLATPVVRSSMPSFPLMHHPQQKRHWTDLIASSVVAERTRPVISVIDVNSVPAVERGGSNEDEEDLGVSSPNSTLSSVSAGKREQREESETGRAFSGGGGHTSDDEDGGDGSRKKLRLSKDQSAVLEESFKEQNTLNPKQKLALAKQLNLRPRQVEVWFQNRRARTKLKQTEVDCEFLKRCCENLTEENRRLQKEVQDLRALKLSPQFYMQMTPPTTLTMCPSCERVAVSSAAAPTTTSTPTSSPQTDARQQRSSSNGGGVSSGINLQCPQQPQQQHPFFMHRPTPIAGVGMPVLPWAPTPLRASKFLDLTSQRS